MDEFLRATTEVAARDGAVFFGVLGPLTVLQGGAAVAVGGPKERVVLAQLLARANQVVSIDALVEAVWADRPPRSAERTLQAYVARLRGILEPDRPSGVESTMLVRTGLGLSAPRRGLAGRCAAVRGARRTRVATAPRR